MTPPNTFLPLRQLAVGQSACVAYIAGEPDDVHRLEEFGLRPGIRIEMFRPGNPCIVRVAGNKVCIRVDHSLNVLVRPMDTAVAGRHRHRHRNGWHR